MSKKSKSSTSQNSTTSIDPQQRQMITDLYNRALPIADKPYEAYAGQTLAGPNATQQQAYGMVTDTATGNVGGAALEQAIGGTQAAQGYRPMQVSAGSSLGMVGNYMNPYLDNVAGDVLSNLDRARLITQNSNAAAADAAHAFGGSRHGVVDAENNRNFYETAGDQLGKLYSQGYDTAMASANTDLNRDLTAQTTNAANAYSAANLGLTASNQLATLGDKERTNAYQDAAMLESVGNTQQAQTQAQLDDSYNKFLEEQNYGKNQVGFLSNIVYGMPSLGGTTTGTATTTQQPSAWDSAMKLGSTIAGFWPSDENIKSGRKPASGSKALRAVEKMPVETWRYDPAKGGPNDGGVEHVGPMAQSIQKNLGIGNGRMIPLGDAVGASFAATKELAKKVRKLEAKKGSRK